METITSAPVKKNYSPSGDGTGEIVKKDIFEKFVHFMSLPDPDKAELFEIKPDPKTGKYPKIPSMKDFAIKYGVHQNTLTMWRNRDDFLKMVEKRRRQWGVDKTPNVLASLYSRCLKYGMAYDVETYLSYYEGWNRKQVIEDATDKFSMEDLKTLISVLPKEEQDKFYATVSEIITKAELLRSSQEVSQLDTPGSADDQGEVR